MIRNDNKAGNYYVLVYSGRNSIAGFECPTLEDVHLEVRRIVEDRDKRGLPTAKAEARLMLRPRTRKDRDVYGPVIPIPIRQRNNND